MPKGAAATTETFDDDYRKPLRVEHPVGGDWYRERNGLPDELTKLSGDEPTVPREVHLVLVQWNTIRVPLEGKASWRSEERRTGVPDRLVTVPAGTKAWKVPGRPGYYFTDVLVAGKGKMQMYLNGRIVTFRAYNRQL